MVARATSEPVFFVRAPRAAPDLGPKVLKLRNKLAQSDSAWRTVKSLRRKLSGRKAHARRVFLTEGYLYSEDPKLAFALVSQVRLRDLFDAPRVWIQRGERTLTAKLQGKKQYVFADGLETGQRVRLLHLDRVGTGELPSALHRDFRSLRCRLFFERPKVRHHTAEFIVADLRYGDLWIPTVLRSDGPRLRLVAEVVEPSQSEPLRSVRQRLEKKMRAVEQMRLAMRGQIRERLPFDEPKTEKGQEDGKLRGLWREAYLAGRSRYSCNGDYYNVFNGRGRPLVPQVCIDFITDTFERAGGSWYRGKAAKRRERTTGKLELAALGLKDDRRTPSFIRFARQREDLFEVLSFPANRRIEVGHKERFFRWLAQNVDAFAPGDIVLIRGPIPRDPDHEHSHTFFIYEIDPITGVPIAVAGNAGHANLWTWETEARRAPHRTLRTRIRPRLEWLQSFLATDSTEPPKPPLLTTGR